jgi:hypothetical protein
MLPTYMRNASLDFEFLSCDGEPDYGRAVFLPPSGKDLAARQ